LEEQWTKNLSGVSFPDVRMRMSGEEFRGPMLFTHRGISGPATFALSSLCAFEKISREAPLALHLDFCPDQDYENLKGELKNKMKGQSLAKVVGKYVTKSFVRECCADLDKAGAEVGEKTINRAVEILKNTVLTVTGRLPGDEFVTAGGIDLTEIDSKTMQSRICPGLYFAGEIVNIDGFTGGYNLQVAWATGRLAGDKIFV